MDAMRKMLKKQRLSELMNHISSWNMAVFHHGIDIITRTCRITKTKTYNGLKPVVRAFFNKYKYVERANEVSLKRACFGLIEHQL